MEDEMYAIIETKGHQYEISENSKIRVNNIDGEIGSEINIDKVLLINDDTNLLVGNPYVNNAKVVAEIVSKGKGKKVLIYKFKGRKKYRRKRGYRDQYVDLLIKNITY